MQMQFFIYDANVSCRDENAKFIHDDASARIQTMMQMSPYRDGDANVLYWVCHDVNVLTQTQIIQKFFLFLK